MTKTELYYNKVMNEITREQFFGLAKKFQLHSIDMSADAYVTLDENDEPFLEYFDERHEDMNTLLDAEDLRNATFRVTNNPRNNSALIIIRAGNTEERIEGWRRLTLDDIKSLF